MSFAHVMISFSRYLKVVPYGPKDDGGIFALLNYVYINEGKSRQ